MPELPEVETVKLGLARHIIGKEIKNIFWSGKPMRRAITTIPNNQIAPTAKQTKDLEKILQSRWRGRKIIDVRRRAKYLIIDGSPMVDNTAATQSQPSAGDTKRLLLCHLGMSGFFRFWQPSHNGYHDAEDQDIIRCQAWAGEENPNPALKEMMQQKHLHVLMLLNNGLLAFYDPRRFGFVADMASDSLPSHAAMVVLGQEPEEAKFEYLWQALQKYKLSLKSFLLNQKIIVGIGNIYAAEILWLAGLSPTRLCHTLNQGEAKKLLAAIKKILRQAIKKGGSSFSDFRHLDGELGYFANHWRAYGMAEQPCQQCGRPIKKILQNGRTTYYCDYHQK